MRKTLSGCLALAGEDAQPTNEPVDIIIDGRVIHDIRPTREQAPEGEREEIRQIFRGKGFEGEALDAAVKVITAKRERWIETMMTEEHGLPPINRSSARAAFTTFLAFVVCGSVPLFPFVLGTPASITVSTAMTGLTFFLIGSMRSRWSPMPWWRAGIETFTIGIIAAAMAYLVGVVLGSAL